MDCAWQPIEVGVCYRALSVMVCVWQLIEVAVCHRVLLAMVCVWRQTEMVAYQTKILQSAAKDLFTLRPGKPQKAA